MFDNNINAYETDILFTKDLIPVITHDFRLDPSFTKDEDGNWIKDENIKIFDLKYDEISKFVDSKYCVTVNTATSALTIACKALGLKKGDILSKENMWVKRPGTGKIFALDFEKVLNKVAKSDIPKDSQIDWNMFE